MLAVRVSGVLAVAGLLVSGPLLGTDWAQFDFDSRHSGSNPEEIIVHTGNVSTLHMRYSVVLPAIADGAPAFLSGVVTPQGVKDLLFLTTKDGRILAVDADTGATVWSKQPATGPNFTTSSPAIDPSRAFVYSYALEGRVHKYQVGDGAEIATGGWPQLATLKPIVEKGSSALSVATAANGKSYLYVTNGGYPGDAGDYQGHVTAIDLATGSQRVFNANCSDQTVHFTTGGLPDCPAVQTAIWARAGVVYDSDNDRIFMATGNGNFDANVGGHDWGDSVFALHPDGTGVVVGPVDSYTPTEFQQLQNLDADLGSTAPAILPAPAGSRVAHLGAQSGKDGQIRLLNLDNLSGQGSPAHLAGELQKIPVPQGGEVLTAPAVWVNPVDSSTWLFLANSSGISGLQLTVDGSGTPSLVPRWTTLSSGTSPVVANGIVYYAGTAGLRGLDPTTGSLLWSEVSIGGIHWESPIVVQGRLYVTDENGRLWAFEPAPAPLGFFTVVPCRVVDTRGPVGTWGGPPLSGSGSRRLFPIAGRCGVPADALAVAANITVVGPSGPGFVRVLPSGIVVTASSIHFAAGQVRANNVVVPMTGNPLGSIVVEADIFPGTTAFVFDVSGYFR
jgi:outer membrane protein assembly factor BamB